MGRNYKFTASLDSAYTKNNIICIFKNINTFKCVYKDREYNTINAAGAPEIVWNQYLLKTPPLIRIECKNTYFTIWFYNENNKMYLYLSPSHIAWKKSYNLCDWYGIHFYRYQRFMLDLVGNNIINHFETYEYFDASYNTENLGHNKKIYIKFYTYWPYDIYHHFKVNSHILGMTWQDAHSQPINLKQEENTLETILYHEDITQCWYGIKDNIKLKFTLHKKLYFIVEPMYNTPLNNSQLDQKKLFNDGLRITIELFKNMPILRFITFQDDKDIEAINTMDEQ